VIKDPLIWKDGKYSQNGNMKLRNHTNFFIHQIHPVLQENFRPSLKLPVYKTTGSWRVLVSKANFYQHLVVHIPDITIWLHSCGCPLPIQTTDSTIGLQHMFLWGKSKLIIRYMWNFYIRSHYYYMYVYCISIYNVHWIYILGHIL
jgi:hypothetical protein